MTKLFGSHYIDCLTVLFFVHPVVLLVFAKWQFGAVVSFEFEFLRQFCLHPSQLSFVIAVLAQGTNPLRDGKLCCYLGVCHSAITEHVVN